MCIILKFSFFIRDHVILLSANRRHTFHLELFKARRGIVLRPEKLSLCSDLPRVVFLIS